MAHNDDNDFDFEKASRMAGLSPLGEVGGDHEDEEEAHAKRAQDAYRKEWDESHVFVDSNGFARRVDFSYPPQGKDQNHDDVDDATIIGEDGRGEFDTTPPKPREVSASELIKSYREGVEEWRSGFATSSDAHVVAELQRKRTEDMSEIMRRGLAQDERLDGLEAYMSADIAWGSRPDPRDSEYADYVQQRNLVRQGLFTKKGSLSLNDRVDSVETYARATASISKKMMGEKHIDKQYELLSVRQEAVLEHFNNPRFAAQVGLYKRNNINDELLVDFDRWDLRDKTSKERSKVLADIFTEKVKFRPMDDASGKARTISKVQRFQDLRETGRAISHNQDAIIQFAHKSQKMPGRGDIEIGPETLELGLQAMDDKKFSNSVMEEWLNSMPRAERKQVANEPVALFRKARETFERDYDAFAKGRTPPKDSSVAASFAVMERSAEEILRNYPKYNRNGQLNNPDDLGALALFSDKYREKNLDKIPAQIDATLMERLGKSENDLLHDGTKTGVATHKPKSKGGEAYHLDLDSSGNEVHIEVADGNHLRLSNSRADAEAGKFVQLRLEGLATPEMGQQTKNGMRDAGEAAKGRLEEFISEYGTGQSKDRMGLEIIKNNHGDNVLKATLPSGESLSQRMILDGYGLPTNDSEGVIRREGIAKNAEKARRGLWKDGFPEVDRDWRSENQSPSLRAKDKRERLADRVGESMATSGSAVASKLSHRETKIFALPLRAWSSRPVVDKEIDKITRTNPGRLSDIYDNNMEILKDLRKRKDKLTQTEKVAHDRLDMGRRALGKSLMEHGHLDPEKLEKDGHPMMSREGRLHNLDALRPIGAMAKSAANTANKYATMGLKKAPGLVSSVLNVADEISR